MKQRIYVADDDRHILNLLVTHLSQSGYEVLGFPEGRSLLREFRNLPCDLIVTDIMMPEMGGYDLCREIRVESSVPILMISANSDEIDRILGLELGADDYIGKPISFRELTAKIKNILRRIAPQPFAEQAHLLRYMDLVLDTDAHTVSVLDVPMGVTPKEFGLLQLLLRHPNRTFAREQLIASVWDYDYEGDARQVDHLVKRLRKKMVETGTQSQIKTVWGVGYRLGGADEA